MKSGRILWDELYYRYTGGIEAVDRMRADWATLKGQVDDERFDAVTAYLGHGKARGGLLARRGHGLFRKLLATALREGLRAQISARLLQEPAVRRRARMKGASRSTDAHS